MVKVIGAQPILNERFSLTCDTAGTIYSIHWMKNGWPLYADNRTDFSMNYNTLTFNCSASSQPLSQFSWFFNGSQVATGSVYETGPLTLACHGEYNCVAFNNITCRNSTVSKMLTVVGESVTAA